MKLSNFEKLKVELLQNELASSPTFSFITGSYYICCTKSGFWSLHFFKLVQHALPSDISTFIINQLKKEHQSLGDIIFIDTCLCDIILDKQLLEDFESSH
jgi:hypothetical protein